VNTMRAFVAILLVAVLCGLVCAGPSQAAPRAGKKIVFIASHGHHPNEKGIALMAKCLESSPNVPALVCETYDDWPADASTLNDADAVVIYSEGTNKKGMPHPILQGDRLALLDTLAKKGVGIVCIHYTLYATREVEAPYLLKWIGAYYDFQGYGSAHFVSRKPLVNTPASPDHPVSRGWGEFTIAENEYYHNLRFVEDGKGVTLLVTAQIASKTSKEVKPYVIGWAFERPGGGRGIGFGGGHFHDSWAVPGYRRFLLNAVVWAARIDVPKDGVTWAVSDEELGLKKK